MNTSVFIRKFTGLLLGSLEIGGFHSQLFDLFCLFTCFSPLHFLCINNRKIY